MSDTTTDPELAALEAEAAELERQAAASEPAKEARAKAAARTRADEARAKIAANAKLERENAMAARAAAARKRLGAGAAVLGVDLVGLFPLGMAPPADVLPTGGVVIVRDPAPAAAEQVHREIEAKERPVASVMTELIASCTVDPASGPDAIKFREFLDSKPDAAITIGGLIRELGGARSKAEKRGRV